MEFGPIFRAWFRQEQPRNKTGGNTGNNSAQRG